MSCSNGSSIFGGQIGSSIFGIPNKYVKFLNSNAVAIDGPSLMETMLLNDIRIPYNQILRSRITLKAGQLNYLLNFLSLGDNATFLFIVARYDASSVNEEDNYIKYNYFDNLSTSYYFGPLLFLSGNSTNRIKQIYLTNPNPDYAVSLEVMVGIIDDNYSYFTDVVNQSGISFTQLTYLSIDTNVVDESIVLYDNLNPRGPLAYINLNTINTIKQTDNILVIDDTSIGTFILDFNTAYDARQAYSLINYSLETSGVIIHDLSPITDDIAPIVYFHNTAGSGGNLIYLNGATGSGPYNTSQGTIFSSTVSLSTYGGSSSAITLNNLVDLVINTAHDNRDGTMSFTGSNIYLYNSSGIGVSSIGNIGTYSMQFNFSDIAGNYVSEQIILNLNITT